MRSLALLIAPLLLLAAVKNGPEVGAKLPDFAAPDQTGKTHTLASLLGPKGAMLVVYRSADWCPFCKAQLVELEQNAKEFQKLGLNVVGLSYDSVAVLKNFSDRKGIHFPLLSDPDSKIIRELGILNEEVPKNTPFFGIPHPATYIVDAKAIVVARYSEDGNEQRYTAGDILVQRYGLAPESPKNEVAGKQLSAIASASNSVVATGQRIALMLDLDLKPNMHVYAPGVDGYIPIEWKMKDSEAWATHQVSYPQPEILFLKAIDEKVPVFKGHLRLVRDITIGANPKIKPPLDATGQFTVEGSLRYQACDDRMCYIPQELPLKWTLRYEGLDPQRVPVELQRK